MTTIQVEATIACPQCGHRAREAMPMNACQWFYECRNCGTLLKPRQGDCCVYCSYGDVPCPPVQDARLIGDGSACCRAPASID